MENNIFETLARIMYEQCGFLCHQLETRSLWIAGVPLPVCSRCTGIYTGALYAFLAFWLPFRWNGIYQLRKWSYWTAGVAIGFLLFDVYAGYRMYGDLHPVRFISGYLFGFIIFFLIWSWIKKLTIDNNKANTKLVRKTMFFTATSIGLSLSAFFYILYSAEPWFFYLSLTAVFAGILILYTTSNTLIFFWIFSNLRHRCGSALCFWISLITGVVLFIVQMIFIQWAGLSI